MKIVALMVLVCGVAWGQSPGKRRMTFEDLMAMKRVSDPQVSPSGKWVLFSVTEVSLEKNTKTNHLWVVPIGGGGKTEAGSSASPRNDNQEKQMTTGTANETNGRFSPDGRWVLYTSDVGGESQLWLAPWNEAAGTMASPRSPLTAVSGGADGGVWSPDSKRVMFVAGVYPECSEKGAGSRKADSFAALRNDNKEAGAGPTHHDETVMNGARSVGGDATWAEEDACDRAKDEAAAKSPVKAKLWTGLLYRHWNAYTGLKRSHVLVVDASDGLHVGEHVRDLTPESAVGDAETPTFSLGGPLGYAWAPDSKEIAYVANLDAVPAASTNNDVFTLRLDEAGARPVKLSTSRGSDDGPAYSPDGKWLAFRSQARAGYESDRFRLMVFDREKKTAFEATSEFKGWIDEFTWVPDSAAIVFASATQGMEAIYSIGILPKQKPTDRPVFVGLTSEGEYGELQVSQAKRGEGDVTLVATKMMATSPAEVVKINAGMLGHTFYDISVFNFGKVADPKETGELVEVSEASNGTEKKLTHINLARLDEVNLAPLNYFWFTGAEGTKVQAFLIKPPNFDPAKKYPVKFLIHGGPEGAWGDAWSYRWNPELMAASGYVVVMVNPRGSTGYGQAFIDGVNGDWGGKAYEDLMRGLDAAEAQFPFIDKDRECALGASYGGYMANWVLTHTNRFRCIVTHDGMYNPAAAYGDTEEMWFNEWEFRRRMPDGSLDKEPASPWRYASLPASEDPFRQWSPMLHIQDAKTPTLVIHSQRDYRLDVSEGLQLFTALQRLGVPSEMLYFPDEGHWVLKPQNADLWNKTVSDWCDRWTKSGRYAGAAEEGITPIKAEGRR